MCVVYECLYTNELIKWRSGQLIVLYTVIGFLICFLCLYVCVCTHLHICVLVCVCACRPGNKAMCIDDMQCVCVWLSTLCVCMFVCARLSVLQFLAQLYLLLVILV